jgi:hypothetical protein
MYEDGFIIQYTNKFFCISSLKRSKQSKITWNLYDPYYPLNQKNPTFRLCPVFVRTKNKKVAAR